MFPFRVFRVFRGYFRLSAQKHRLAEAAPARYLHAMVIIRFDDNETEMKALDYLVGRFSFKTWASGDLMVPEPALGHLAAEGVTFHVKGPATYEHFLPATQTALENTFPATGHLADQPSD